MQVYNQGEEYQEDEFEDGELEEESEEDTEAKITQFYGIPLKKAAVIGAIALVVIVLLILFATRNTGSTEEELEAYVPEETAELVEEAVPVETPDTTDTSNTDTSSDDMVYNPDTGLWEEAFVVEETEEVEPETATDEEILKLRSMGYTGDEIEYSLANGFSVDDLVAAAEKLYDVEADKALKRMSDSASEEFRYIVDNTYFSQPGYEFEPIEDKEVGTYDYATNSYVVNADYVKCPTYGSQLQLKCRVAQDLWVWYIITPNRWESLPNEGNIVLKVDYTQYGVNMYVTKVTETDPTLDTIDSSSITTDQLNITDGTGNNQVSDSKDVSESADSESIGEQSVSE